MPDHIELASATLAVLGRDREVLLKKLERNEDLALEQMKILHPGSSLRTLGAVYGISYKTVQMWMREGIKRRKKASNKA